MSLQDLLGPTWKQRVRAADALLPLLARDEAGTVRGDEADHVDEYEQRLRSTVARLSAFRDPSA